MLVLGATASRAQAPVTDVILLASGDEIPGRVVSITPLQVCYLPPAGADTLRLAAAEVFLIRYANGTREVLHPAPAGPTETDLLPGQNEGQRRALARQDAGRYYTDRAPFWGSLGATLYGGPLLGLVAPALIAPHQVAERNLNAPRPALLADPAYNYAYRREAQHLKHGRAWGGYGAGVGAYVVLIAVLVAGMN